MLADLQTPVGWYLKVRERYHHSVLLESTDFDNNRDNHSYIAFDPLACFTVRGNTVELSYPDGFKEVIPWSGIQKGTHKKPDAASEKGVKASQNEVHTLFQAFSQQFPEQQLNAEKPGSAAHAGMFGYLHFEAVRYLDPELRKLSPAPPAEDEENIPEICFTLYRFVLIVNHSQNTLILREYTPDGGTPELNGVLQWLDGAVHPGEPFQTTGAEHSLMSDDAFDRCTEQALKTCRQEGITRLSLFRRYRQPFGGDDFKVYRTLRSLAPSAYLFFFDYGEFRVFGSSPEPLLSIHQGKVQISATAGQVRRTGDDSRDRQALQQLQLSEPDSSRQHEWMVNRAMEQLGRHASNVRIDYYCEVRQHARMAHLESRVSGEISAPGQGMELLRELFPYCPIAGIPKHRAIETICSCEPHARGFFGGCVGFLGLQGDMVLAVTRRSILSHRQALSLAMNTRTIQQGQMHPASDTDTPTLWDEALRQATLLNR